MAGGQLPHGLLIYGPAGTGRRLLALWLACRVLETENFALAPGVTNGEELNPELMPVHPDLMLVQPKPDKRRIAIDQVREMIHFLQLTSHQRGAKVSLLSPAQTLTRQAANSLLKTLEEPPAGSVILLVADSLSRLPATVVSRCSRLRVSVPAPEQGLAWLHEHYPGSSWETILNMATGAPLTALEYRESGFEAEVAELEKDIQALQHRQISPITTARRWARRDADRCLRWLYLRAGTEIRGSLAGETAPESEAGHLQNRGINLSLDSQFSYLREIGELRRLGGTGINIELNLMHLLGRWYGGFL